MAMGRPQKAITYLDRCLLPTFLMLCSEHRAINIHPDDTFILTMRAQASKFQVCVIPGISDLLQAKLAVADYQGAMEDASNVMFRS